MSQLMPLDKQKTSLNFSIPQNLQKSLQRMIKYTGKTREEIIAMALQRFLQLNSVYQSAPVNALVQGIYRENLTIGNLKNYGDFGIGTFNDLDGEMIMLDGKVFQMRADGKIYTVDDSTKTPFACVTFFSPDTLDDIEGDFDYESFIKLLDNCIPSPNMVYAVRLDGEFSYVKTRSVPKQETYRPLVEVAREQPEFEFNDITGIMVGFYTPTFIQSLNIPGYHLHFISSDHQHGGHLLECKLKKGRLGIKHAPTIECSLPVTLDFLTVDLNRDVSEDIEEAEK